MALAAPTSRPGPPRQQPLPIHEDGDKTMNEDVEALAAREAQLKAKRLFGPAAWVCVDTTPKIAFCIILSLPDDAETGRFAPDCSGGSWDEAFEKAERLYKSMVKSDA
jgi:hypothetical protein